MNFDGNGRSRCAQTRQFALRNSVIPDNFESSLFQIYFPPRCSRGFVKRSSTDKKIFFEEETVERDCRTSLGNIRH